MTVTKGSFWQLKTAEKPKFCYKVELVFDNLVTLEGVTATYPVATFLLNFEPVPKADEPPFFRVVKGIIERATEHSVGFDIFYTGKSKSFDEKGKLVDNPEGDIAVGDVPILLGTGLYTEMSAQFAAILKERSGLGLKGFELKAGVIDADYDKEWGVVARFPMRFVHHFLPIEGRYVSYRDTDWQPFIVKPGDKIAQFVVIEKPKFELIEGQEGEVRLSYQKRAGGFGSTGS